MKLQVLILLICSLIAVQSFTNVADVTASCAALADVDPHFDFTGQTAYTVLDTCIQAYNGGTAVITSMKLSGLNALAADTDFAAGTWTALAGLTLIEIDYTAASTTDVMSTLLTTLATKTLATVTIQWRAAGGATGAGVDIAAANTALQGLIDSATLTAVTINFNPTTGDCAASKTKDLSLCQDIDRTVLIGNCDVNSDDHLTIASTLTITTTGETNFGAINTCIAALDSVINLVLDASSLTLGVAAGDSTDAIVLTGQLGTVDNLTINTSGTLTEAQVGSFATIMQGFLTNVTTFNWIQAASASDHFATLDYDTLLAVVAGSTSAKKVTVWNPAVSGAAECQLLGDATTLAACADILPMSSDSYTATQNAAAANLYMKCTGATVTFAQNASPTWINDAGITWSDYTPTITGTGITNNVLDLSAATAGAFTVTNTFVKSGADDIVVTGTFTVAACGPSANIVATPAGVEICQDLVLSLDAGANLGAVVLADATYTWDVQQSSTSVLPQAAVVNQATYTFPKDTLAAAGTVTVSVLVNDGLATEVVVADLDVTYVACDDTDPAPTTDDSSNVLCVSFVLAALLAVLF